MKSTLYYPMNYSANTKQQVSSPPKPRALIKALENQDVHQIYHEEQHVLGVVRNGAPEVPPDDYVPCASELIVAELLHVRCDILLNDPFRQLSLHALDRRVPNIVGDLSLMYLHNTFTSLAHLASLMSEKGKRWDATAQTPKRIFL